MIVKQDKNKCTQKCLCGELIEHIYSNLKIKNDTITLPPCEKCGSLEFLIHNNQNDAHSILVAQVFANVATQEL